MFSNLSKGSVLYGLDTSKNSTVFTGTVDRVSIPMPKTTQTTFGQIPEMVVDIWAIINGNKQEFKQVPANAAIADFGPNTVVLADNKDSLINYVNTTLQTSKDILNSIDKHKEIINRYETILSQLSPSISNDNIVKELKEQVSDLQSQLSEALSLLKSEKPKLNL